MSQNQKSSIKNFFEFYLLFGFILLVFVNVMAFINPKYSDILGDPSREAKEFSWQYFFAGFLILWILITLILIQYLAFKIRKTKIRFVNRFVNLCQLFWREIKTVLTKKLAFSENQVSANLSQKSLKKLEKFLIFFSVVIGIISYLNYLLRLHNLTNSKLYAILILLLIVFVPIFFTVLIKNSNK